MQEGGTTTEQEQPKNKPITTAQELMDEVASHRLEIDLLREELEKVTRERDSYKSCWEESCWTADEISIPLERV